MSSLVLSCPGKSFIAGEYLAMKGGPCLLSSTKPRFELLARPGTGQVLGIHFESPAGKLIRAHHDFFQKYDLDFNDPHEGRGGWGASTAEFLMAFVLNEWRESCELETLKSLSISRLLERYWQFAWNGEGFRPSGADVVAQYKGSLTSFERNTGMVSSYGWIFHEIDFALIPTGKKLPTHEHLKTLADFDEVALDEALRMTLAGLQAGSAAEFVRGLQANAAALETLNFVASHTQHLLQSLRTAPGVLAAKGCGAQGADVMLVVYETARAQEFNNFLAAKNLSIVAGSRDLTHGLEIQVRD